jgi:hypothetical protein
MPIENSTRPRDPGQIPDRSSALRADNGSVRPITPAAERMAVFAQDLYANLIAASPH